MVVSSAPAGGTAAGGAPMGGGRWVCSEIKGKVRRGTRERETSASGGDGIDLRSVPEKGDSARNGGKSEPEMGGDRPAVEVGRDLGSLAIDSPAKKAQALVKVSVLPTLKR